jgi:hypothetical protein
MVLCGAWSENSTAPSQLTQFWQIPRENIFLSPCPRHFSSRLPPSGETCKHAMTPITQTNFERFSTYWYVPFCCLSPGSCAAEFGSSGETYELSCTRVCVVLSVPGVHFPTNDEHLLSELSRAVRVFLQGLEQLSQDEGNEVVLSPHLSCEGRGEARWRNGDKFFRSVELPKFWALNIAWCEERTSAWTEIYFVIMNNWIAI